MSLLVTIERYQAITGNYDSDSPSISARIEEAQDMLEEALDRGLHAVERTERLVPTRDGWLWPRCVPITVATGYTIDGDGLRGPFGPAWPDETGRVTVTYTGGWVERTANPNATNRLPVYVERDIAFAAFALAAYEPSDHGQIVPHNFPAGATSVRLGDAAVTFGPDGPARPEDQIRWSRRTLAWKHRTERGAGEPSRYDAGWRS